MSSLVEPLCDNILESNPVGIVKIDLYYMHDSKKHVAEVHHDCGYTHTIESICHRKMVQTLLDYSFINFIY